MNYRIVKFIVPNKDNSNVINIQKVNIPVKDDHSVYATVEIFERLLLQGKNINTKTIMKEDMELIKLGDIINLHNDTGIKDVSQIKSMISHIKSGKDILPRGLSNIKLVRSMRNGWIIFDGHHSLLAYMAAGKKYLHEIPHMIVQNQNGYVTDKEIAVFYGEHLKKTNNINWRDYVINWQAPIDEQLSTRVQKNMGELLESLTQKVLFSQTSSYSPWKRRREKKS